MAEKTKKVDSMMRYSPLEIPKIIKAHWNAKVPVNFIAEPSTVKSEGCLQTAKAIAEEEKREFLEWNKAHIDKKKDAITNAEKYFVFGDLRASETDIGELRLQDMKSGEDYITFKYNILFQALSNPKAMGVLFFDEMNLAPNMIKAQFYKIINDRAVGDIPLADNVLCISAGNESEHSRGVTEDPVPLVLRRGNYFLRPLNSEEYVDYAVRTEHHPYVVGYLGFQPNDTHKIEYDLPDSVGQPCPRTWTRLSQILKANDKLTMPEVEMLAGGLVGQGVAKKFAAYVKSARGVDLNAIIAKPELIKQYEKDEDLSLVYAIITGVVEKFRQDEKICGPAFEMTLQFQHAEFGTFLLRAMKSADQKKFVKAGSNDKIVSEKLAQEVTKRYAKYVFQS